MLLKTPIPGWLFITNCLLNQKLFRRAVGDAVIIRQREQTALESDRCGSNPSSAYIN